MLQPDAGKLLRAAQVALLCALVPLSSAFAGPEGEARLDALRDQLELAEGRESWEAVARALLEELDAQGRAHETEARWVVDHLLESVPDDPELLWRRAGFLRSEDDTAAAIADLERLVEAGGEHPLVVRARRALPALYLRAGRARDAARADEELLARRLADPVAVLTRLSHTYARLGMLESLRDTLSRLEAIDDDEVRFDADLAWFRADATDRLGERAKAAATLLRFASQFPSDHRSIEALERAAVALEELGRLEAALIAIDEAALGEGDEERRMKARLIRGRILEGLSRRREAREQYLYVIERSLDPEPAARAVRALLELDLEQRGLDETIETLATLAGRGDGFTRQFAGSHFDRLVRLNVEELTQSDEAALYWYRLATSISRHGELPLELVLRAASALERVGATQEAGDIYERVGMGFGPLAREARESLVRVRPLAEARDVEPDHAGRLEGFEALELWSHVRDALSDERLAAEGAAARRALRARAEFLEGSPSRAGALLEGRMLSDAPEALVLRADARALEGEWERACEDYARAEEQIGQGALGAWIQLRMSACDLRREQDERAQRRLAHLMSLAPGEPIAFAAQTLAAEQGWSLAGEGRDS